ncbi:MULTISPECIES: helix-turn-helix domain-containing protein [unclassified Haladaptatus]|uniref:helix-turn-helix domain-containing protein n=1 Tax=unclassified Haladaptatus TaxID=2622732 RepID=UPI0023E7F131|nr:MULTISPECIES: helix-turn-helix domain-containing protein [unclassified Haladaptatus]
MGDDVEATELFQLLNDSYARMILTETTTEPMSAAALSEACDASLSTIYRRANALIEQGLLVEHTKPDPDGHHYTMYEATVSHVDIDFTEQGIDVSVSTHEDAVDQFARTWAGIRGDDE